MGKGGRSRGGRKGRRAALMVPPNANIKYLAPSPPPIARMSHRVAAFFALRGFRYRVPSCVGRASIARGAELWQTRRERDSEVSAEREVKTRA